jgi:hypothetical protein
MTAQYVTWRQTAGILAAVVLCSASALAWIDHKKLDVDNAQSMEEDIKLIKKCVIEKKC